MCDESILEELRRQVESLRDARVPQFVGTRV
jgi:hypothetical protein